MLGRTESTHITVCHHNMKWHNTVHVHVHNVRVAVGRFDLLQAGKLLASTYSFFCKLILAIN